MKVLVKHTKANCATITIIFNKYAIIIPCLEISITTAFKMADRDNTISENIVSRVQKKSAYHTKSSKYANDVSEKANTTLF